MGGYKQNEVDVTGQQSSVPTYTCPEYKVKRNHIINTSELFLVFWVVVRCRLVYLDTNTIYDDLKGHTEV